MRSAARRADYELVSLDRSGKRCPDAPFDCTDLTDYNSLTRSIPGMVSRENAELLYALCVTQTTRGDVVEIGCWQGKSTSYPGRGVRDSGNGRLFAVGHFLGNAGKEHLYRAGRDDLSDLPNLFETSIKRLGLEDVVTTVPMLSAEAYRVLADKSLRLLFIDGDHTEVGVARDIQLFCPLVLPGGLVVFDDYDDTFPGLVLAVHRWIAERKPAPIFWRGGLLVCRL